MNILPKIIILSLMCLPPLYAQERQELSVHSGFEGGSVKVVSVNQQHGIHPILIFPVTSRLVSNWDVQFPSIWRKALN